MQTGNIGKYINGFEVMYSISHHLLSSEIKNCKYVCIFNENVNKLKNLGIEIWKNTNGNKLQ